MSSSVVADISYNQRTATLRITYVSGAIYDYKNVPDSVYTEMTTSSSKGTYLNTQIKDKYAFKKVK